MKKYIKGISLIGFILTVMANIQYSMMLYVGYKSVEDIAVNMFANIVIMLVCAIVYVAKEK